MFAKMAKSGSSGGSGVLASELRGEEGMLSVSASSAAGGEGDRAGGEEGGLDRSEEASVVSIPEAAIVGEVAGSGSKGDADARAEERAGGEVNSYSRN